MGDTVMMRSLAVLVLLAGLGRAQGMTPQQAADRALAAHEAGDGPRLAKLAQRTDLDPWLVADELCVRAEHDAAAAFARAAPRKDVEHLPAYVALQRDRRADPKARQALAAARETGDAAAALAVLDAAPATAENVVAVRLHLARGALLRSSKRLEESQAAYQAAADLAERLGWLAGTSRALHAAGRLAFGRADWRGAISIQRRRLALEVARGDAGGVAGAHANLGVALEGLGQWRDALQHYERAREIWQELGKKASLASVWLRIGAIQESAGNYEACLRARTQVLEIRTDLDDRPGVAIVLNLLGNVHSRMQAWSDALDHYERARRLSEEIDDRVGVLEAWSNIGAVHAGRGDHAEALTCLRRALQLADEANDRRQAAAALCNIALVYENLEDFPAAREHARRAVRHAEAVGDAVPIGETLLALGSIAEGGYRDFEKALTCYERSRAAFEQRGHRAGAAEALSRIGRIHERLSTSSGGRSSPARSETGWGGRGRSATSRGCVSCRAATTKPSRTRGRGSLCSLRSSAGSGTRRPPGHAPRSPARSIREFWPASSATTRRRSAGSWRTDARGLCSSRSAAAGVSPTTPFRKSSARRSRTREPS